MDKLEHIFEPFIRLERSLTNMMQGTGLGLAISRDLARGMGGNLEVESAVGEGSTFTLTRPRAMGGETSAEACRPGLDVHSSPAACR